MQGARQTADICKAPATSSATTKGLDGITESCSSAPFAHPIGTHQAADASRLGSNAIVTLIKERDSDGMKHDFAFESLDELRYVGSSTFRRSSYSIPGLAEGDWINDSSDLIRVIWVPGVGIEPTRAL